MQIEKMPVGQPLHLRVGELIEVRREAEILATLDENGELDGLPFMPEMLAWCGRRLRVDKLALKLCDTIEWTGMYRIRDAVHLEMSRCDGQAHGGCQAGCSIYWKEAWLKRIPAATRATAAVPSFVAVHCVNGSRVMRPRYSRRPPETRNQLMACVLPGLCPPNFARGRARSWQRADEPVGSQRIL